MRKLGWLIALALVASCKSKSDSGETVSVRPAAGSGSATKPAGSGDKRAGTVAKKGSLARRRDAFFAVILPASADAKQVIAAATAAGKKLGFEILDAPKDVPGASMYIDPTTPEKVGWVRGESETGEFVPAKDRAAIDAATVAIGIVGTEDGVGGGLAEKVAKVAIVAATAGKGWVMDLDTHLLHTVASLIDHVPTADAVDVRKHVMLHGVSGEHDLAFVDTVGMQRLGLPEVRISDVPPARVNEVSNALNAAVQTLVDQGDLTRDGQLVVDLAKLRGDWGADEVRKSGGTAQITWVATWSRGDAPEDEKLAPEDYVIELSIAGAKRGSAEALLAALEKFTGATEDKVHHFDFQPELDAAAVKARAALTKLRPHFAKGIPPGEQLGVKAPFTTDDGGIEWMWVDVASFKGEVLDGTLDNDPEQVSTLKIGARVKVKLSELADFIHRQADGKAVGGFSLEVMRAHGVDVPPL